MILKKEEQERVDSAIIELWETDITVTEMSIKIGRSVKHLSNRIKYLKAIGSLPNSRKKRIVRNPEPQTPTRERNTGCGTTTLDDGETVCCNKAISKTCIYGVSRNDPNAWDLCHYLLITGHSRKCPHTVCDKYGRISADNPRREFGSRVGQY